MVFDANELQERRERCLAHLARLCPDAAGLLVFSRVNIYYLAGTLGAGVLWLPRDGEPALLLRKGEARARRESPLARIGSFKSYGELPARCAELGSPWPAGGALAAEKAGLPWNLADLLTSRLSAYRFDGGDAALAHTRMVKSEAELGIMRRAGALHHEALARRLPAAIRPGMTERDVAAKLWEICFALGHGGMMRMSAPGEEIFLGHIAAGESGNYPSYFNGPLGVVGVHPAVPTFASGDVVWRPGDVLMADTGFIVEGYHTDKTQAYFAGPASKAPDALRRAFDATVAIQRHAAERLKPGVTPAEIYAASLQEAEALGMAEGFMGLGGNKVPFLGHGIGLWVDEFPPLAAKVDVPLEVGMTLALEPKIGVPGQGMAGVENTFEVTANGGRCLTGDEYELIPVEA